MNYIKIILCKDIGNIISKYLLPSKIFIENDRKLNLVYLNDYIEWIKIYLNDDSKQLRYSRKYLNGYYWTMT